MPKIGGGFMPEDPKLLNKYNWIKANCVDDTMVGKIIKFVDSSQTEFYYIHSEQKTYLVGGAGSIIKKDYMSTKLFSSNEKDRNTQLNPDYDPCNHVKLYYLNEEDTMIFKLELVD
jgi:hypothetical protein